MNEDLTSICVMDEFALKIKTNQITDAITYAMAFFNESTQTKVINTALTKARIQFLDTTGCKYKPGKVDETNYADYLHDKTFHDDYMEMFYTELIFSSVQWEIVWDIVKYLEAELAIEADIVRKTLQYELDKIPGFISSIFGHPAIGPVVLVPASTTNNG